MGVEAIRICNWDVVEILDKDASPDEKKIAKKVSEMQNSEALSNLWLFIHNFQNV